MILVSGKLAWELTFGQPYLVFARPSVSNFEIPGAEKRDLKSRIRIE